VRKIAIPGAVGQIAVATLLGLVACKAVGIGSTEGLIVGIAVSVASTVVLIRVLVDNNVLETPQGHIAVGWLIVEDIFTVLALVALPALSKVGGDADAGGQSLVFAIMMALVKISVLALIVLGSGQRAIPWFMGVVARTRSRELFTLCVLALALAIATGSAYFFDVSMALGAFLAGMVVGQTEVSHQAAADALPMRDAFAVMFFVSVGMLFDPHAVVANPQLLLLLLAVILVAKPLTALVIVWLLRYSWQAAITIAIALAQVGEFSFLLADTAMKYKLMSEDSRSLLVAAAMISITLNPLLFHGIEPLNQWLRKKPTLWRYLSGRAEVGGVLLNELAKARLADPDDDVGGRLRAVIVGYGPVGQTSARILRDFNIEPIVVDLNLDTVRDITGRGDVAVYGDATRRDILEAASIGEAKYLLVTVPDVLVRTLVIITARELNENIRVFARARYLKERAWLEEVGATDICIEEAETAVGLAVLLLNEVGADQDRIRAEVKKLHEEFGVQRPEIVS
jgi:CPA2 family monovalent cation:H+ antiporter-2